jgi:very-short-patch-repair endonuclease
MKRELKIKAINRCRELRKESTKSEKLFWGKVRNRKFEGKKFNRQFPIFYSLDGKENFFIADFYCHQEKLVVEIDGDIHINMKEKDEFRTEILNELGYNVVRFKNKDVEDNIDEVLLKLKLFINSP